jgi:hypothetical protein
MLRKILRVKTVGSRASGNLKPLLTNALPQGVHLTVLEYNESNGTCIVEIYGSDSEMAVKPITAEILNSVKAHQSVIEELQTHSLSPKKIAGFSVPDKSVTVDTKTGEVTHNTTGKKAKLIRTETDYRGDKTVVVDEG